MYSFGALIQAFGTGWKNRTTCLVHVSNYLTTMLFSSRDQSNRSLWRFSVGGADYGSVRVGAHMGRRIIQCAASKQCEGLKALAAEEVDDPEIAFSLEDAREQYLCNIPPHRCKRFRITNVQ